MEGGGGRYDNLKYYFMFLTGELFRIIYGLEKPGDDLTRDAASAWKAAKGGLAAHKYEKPPIADQVHVVIWVISATDVRFEQGKYRENINFVQHILKRESKSLHSIFTKIDRFLICCRDSLKAKVTLARDI